MKTRLWFLALALWSAADAGAEEWVDAAVHVHTDVSTGVYSAEEWLRKARTEGLDAVFFADSLLRDWEYGLPPLRGLLRHRVSQPSVLAGGAGRYIAGVAKADASVPGVQAFAGVEAAPFYYWERSPLSPGGGRIAAWHRHLLVFGLNAEALASLPVRFSPYGGDLHEAPYQEFIDAVNAAGGLVFWAHPATGHRGAHGRIEERTDPYENLLRLTRDFDGFAMTYLGYLDALEPEGLWDEMLLEYCRGRRARPSWLLAEVDVTGDSRPLTKVTTHFASPRAGEDLMDVMRRGGMWARFAKSGPAPRLERFEARDGAGRAASLGESAGEGPLRVVFSGSCEDANALHTVKLIVNGKLWDTRAAAGARVNFEWDLPAGTERGYVRLQWESSGGIIYTNPILFGD